MSVMGPLCSGLRALVLTAACVCPSAEGTDPGRSSAGEDEVVYGRVVGSSGQPVVDAEILFLPLPPPMPVDLWATRFAADHQHQIQATRSGADGRFRIGHVARGTLLVRTGSGLGALVRNVAAGAPELVRLAPMGAIGGLHEGMVQVAIETGDGHAPQRWMETLGPRLQLPSGVYRLLETTPDGHPIAEHRVQVQSAKVILLPPLEGGRPWNVMEDFAGTLTLADWPHHPLQRIGNNILVPGGAGLRTVQVEVHEPEGIRVEQHVERPAPLRSGAGQWRSLQVEGEDQLPVAHARIYTLSVLPVGRIVRARSVTDEQGQGHFLVVPGESLVWIWSEHHAPRLVEVTHSQVDLPTVRLESGEITTLRLVTEQGTPLAGARVRLFPAAPEPWEWNMLETADQRGWVRFGRLPGGRHLARLESKAHLQDVVSITVPGTTDNIMKVRSGASLRGRVYVVRSGVDEASPAAHVLVTLRDSSGLLSGERTTTSDPDGWFQFDGLPPEQGFVLFGTLERGPETWSGRVRGAQPGPHEWRLELRHEDPPPPGGRIR